MNIGNDIDIDWKDGRNPRDANEIEEDVGVGGPFGAVGGPQRGEEGRNGCANVFAEDEGCGGREINHASGGQSDGDAEGG